MHGLERMPPSALIELMKCYFSHLIGEKGVAQLYNFICWKNSFHVPRPVHVLSEFYIENT